ncbi:hypothetical protein HDK64DRAFT_58545 [Phyllosticta capitalensis]
MVALVGASHAFRGGCSCELGKGRYAVGVFFFRKEEDGKDKRRGGVDRADFLERRPVQSRKLTMLLQSETEACNTILYIATERDPYKKQTPRSLAHWDPTAGGGRKGTLRRRIGPPSQPPSSQRRGKGLLGHTAPGPSNLHSQMGGRSTRGRRINHARRCLTRCTPSGDWAIGESVAVLSVKQELWFSAGGKGAVTRLFFRDFSRVCRGT